MKKNEIYIGLDVDDTQYHGSALNSETGCQCRSSFPHPVSVNLIGDQPTRISPPWILAAARGVSWRAPVV